MEFSYLTGEVGKFGISRIKKQIISASENPPWYLAGGIDLSNVGAVWQPRGAASQAAAYLRIAGDQGNSNIDPSVVGGVAPTWDVVNGWTGDGATKYLKTGIIPSSTSCSAFVQFNGTEDTQALFGCVNTSVTQFFQILPKIGTVVNYGNGGASNKPPALLSGTLAIAGLNDYRNGLIDAGTVDGPVPNLEIYLLARNYSAGIPNALLAGSIWRFVFYKTIITAAQVLSVDTAVNAYQWTRNYMFDGDSLTAGVGAPVGSDYPSQVMVLFGSDPLYKKTNDGLGGALLSTMITEGPNRIDPLYWWEFTKNVCMIWGGTNDITLGGGQPATQVYNDMITYCQARRAAGWKVVTFSILPRIDMDAPKEAQRVAFNGYIQAGWNTFADAFVDVAADVRLQNCLDLTYYDAGGVHLNAAGYGVVASLVFAQISGL